MIYIQGITGLQAISAQLTKEKIIAALGYTPADQTTFYEDGNGNLLIADEKGYVIARIDENGITTTKVTAEAIALNGEDLATKLQTLSDAIDGIEIPEVDLSNYYNKTEVDTALKNVSVDLTGYAKEEDIPSVEAYDTHVANGDIHVTADQKTAWDAKSDFSGNYSDLEGAPHIVNDNEDEVVICDSAGNVILRATAEGLNVAAVYVNGVRVDEPVMKFKVGTKVLEMTPSTQLWSDWLNSSFNNGVMAANGDYVNYNMVTGQDLHDVTIDDYIIPGYTYTYDNYS